VNDRLRALEAQLQRQFDRGALAVYADELQREGDPRGEIIAFDLDQLATRRKSQERWARRQAASKAWLGDAWEDDRIIDDRFGLIVGGVGSATDLDGLFDAAYADYILGLRIGGSSALLDATIRRIAEAPRPWLAHLVMTRVDLEFPNAEPVAVGEGFADAAPNLRRLTVHGYTHAVLETFSHPNVTSLVVTGIDVLRALARQPWPSVVALDFAFGHGAGFGGDTVETLAAAIAHGFPALRQLDLSRNEPAPPGAGHGAGWAPLCERCHAGELDVFALLAALHLDQLGKLRLPSLRSAAQIEAVQRAIDRMPELAALEIARTYAGTPAVTLQHPAATIPAPCPWPPPDQEPMQTAAIFELGDGQRLAIDEAIALMEGAYAEMEEPQRAAWDELWRVLGACLATDAPGVIDRAILAHAVDVEELVADLNDARGAHLPWVATRSIAWWIEQAQSPGPVTVRIVRPAQ
jgi:hypothetical protein